MQGWSFNPCFLGRWFETIFQFSYTYFIYVSILVFLEDGLRHHPRRLQMGLTIVSILVFLEDGLRPYINLLQNFQIYSVSILVFLEDGLRLLDDTFLDDTFLGFQSLFSWKMVWDHIHNLFLLFLYHCFNPCFLGRWFET